MAALGAWSVAVLAVGIVVGRALAPDAPEPPAPVEIEVALPELDGFDPGKLADVVMIDTAGLDEAAAREALGDVGLGDVEVTVVRTPHAGAAGTVVAQTPAAGTANPGRITLTVSEPAPMPAVAGDAAALRQTLEAMGATVLFVERFDPAAAPGTVLGADVAEGAPIPAQVTLTVAAQPSSIYLDALDPVEGNCRKGTATVNGAVHDHSVLCPWNDRNPAVAAYDLGRHATRLEITAGIADRGAPNAGANIEISGDGRLLASAQVAFGAPAQLVADVTGVLRLEVRVAGTHVGEQRPPSTQVVLGDAALFGSPDGIDALDPA